MSAEKFEYLCRLGDSTLIIGQQLGKWCGHAPILEEDIAVANTALDLIGQATMWLDYAGKVEGKGRTADDLAYFRDSRAFRNVLLVEQPNGEFGATLMRQFLFDAWHLPLLEQLQSSTDPEISAIAEKAEKEARYHLRRSASLVKRLGLGTDDSHQRMQEALLALWPFTGELIEADDIDGIAQAEGYGADTVTIAEEACGNWSKTLLQAGLVVSEDVGMRSGGKTGLHSEGFGYILAEMQSLARAMPGAKW